MTDENICRSLEEVAIPDEARDVLCTLVQQAQDALGEGLSAIVLFGSAAEGRLRATSDINLLIVLKRFVQAEIDPLREALRLARSVANVQAMFVLEEELPLAAEEFAMKFADIAKRRRVLYGKDPIPALTISREAKIRRLRQTLLNLGIRLRERYLMTSLREEQLALVLADTAGPLRVAAATLLDLQGTPAPSAKEALERLAPKLGVAEWQPALVHLSTARETRTLPQGIAAAAFFTVLELTEALRRQAERM